MRIFIPIVMLLLALMLVIFGAQNTQAVTGVQRYVDIGRARGDALTGVYPQDSPSMPPQAARPHSHLDSSPVISTPEFNGERAITIAA